MRGRKTYTHKTHFSCGWSEYKNTKFRVFIEEQIHDFVIIVINLNLEKNQVLFRAFVLLDPHTDFS